MHVRSKLFALKLNTSVQQYTTLFRHLQCELDTPVDDETAQHLYLHGLKEAVKMQVLLQRPSCLEDRIILAERTDQAIMYAWGSSGDKPQCGGYVIGCLREGNMRSTAEVLRARNWAWPSICTATMIALTIYKVV